jgi:beta-phosphoglucomutase-like phosphatase (HAD superfamily)
MIKHIIFDLDGVLVDARDLHYHALNLALAEVGQEYIIDREEHLSTYDGLPTSKKLQMLSLSKGLPTDSHDHVWRLKQEKTIYLIDKMSTDDRMEDKWI